ncbi:hypothetical protein CsSME_00043943 [Camellia sinensis var. sinensis]
MNWVIMMHGSILVEPDGVEPGTLDERTLSSLELPRAVAVATGPSSPISDGGPPSYENQERTEVDTFDGSASLIQHNGRLRQKFQDPAQDISIQLLEKFSLVTAFARETTTQLFRDSNNSDVFGANERRNHDQTPHPYPSIVASNDVEEVPNEIPIASDPLEVTLNFFHFFFCVKFLTIFSFLSCHFFVLKCYLCFSASWKGCIY